MSPFLSMRTCSRQHLVPQGLALTAALIAAMGPSGVHAQFGGGSGFGGGGYNPPAPKCPAFKCGKDEKPVGKPDYKMWSYGCQDTGMNFMSMAGFDPNNPLGGMQKQKSVNKCCIEHDICKQTCGMSSQACHDNFQKCSKKICKGDQNCEMQALLAEIMNEPYDDKEPLDEKYDPDKAKCKGYNRGQSSACTCVKKDEWQSATDTNLKSFYKKFNPEKLNKKGEIKDLDDVWKKWKGKESEMFMALATKYKDKAVEIRVKPKPPPYTPPKEDTSADDSEADAGSTSEEESQQSEAPSAPEPAESPTPDAEAEEFEKAKKALNEKKSKAIEDEDYDAAQQVKDDLRELTKKEVERLKVLKGKAIDDEDYLQAKLLKARLAKLDL